jgi:Domain of unknown function (DUF4440)
MTETEQELLALNLQFAAAEDGGDHAFFEKVLGPAIGFRRGSGAIVDRATYLAGIGKGKRECNAASIQMMVLGKDRAVVMCVVRFQAQPDAEWKDFDNTRLFARDAQGAWKLVGWANEPR